MYTTALFACRQIERYLEPYIVLTTNRKGGGGGLGGGGGGKGWGEIEIHFSAQTLPFYLQEVCPRHPGKPFHGLYSWEQKTMLQGKLYKPTSLRLSEGIPQEVRIPAVPRLCGKADLEDFGGEGLGTRAL